MALTAAKSAFDAIGFIGTALGIVDFAQNNWAANDPQGASVRIKGTWSYFDLQRFDKTN